MESISICVRNSVGKIVMDCLIKTKASTILQFLTGLRGTLRESLKASRLCLLYFCGLNSRATVSISTKRMAWT
jgi:hypothetical protein